MSQPWTLPSVFSYACCNYLWSITKLCLLVLALHAVQMLSGCEGLPPTAAHRPLPNSH
jgi:hypothetical protein